MKTNQEFKSEARSALNGNWAQAVIATIIFMLLLSALCGPRYASVLNISAGSPLILPAYVTYGGTLLIVLVLYPLTAGFMNSFRILFETGDNRLSSNMFTVAFGEGRGWLHLVLGMLLTNVYIFLWSLLLVVPGIIKAFSYAMTPYILVEHPELGIDEAIDKSRDLMRGHKFDYFWLLLSFIGWWVASIITLGIGFIWLIPYIQTATAAFYRELKEGKGDNVLEAERVL